MNDTLSHDSSRNSGRNSGRADGLGWLAHGLGLWFGRVGFGMLVLCAAAAAVVVTTFVGLILALAAVFLGLSHRWARRRVPVAASRSAGPAGTLDARRTADGWVVEPAGR